MSVTDDSKSSSDRTSAGRRETRPIMRRAVLLCGEDTELSPGIVRLIDLAWRRELGIEIVVALGDDPMRALVHRYPNAVFLLVRSADDDSDVAELAESFARHRSAAHSMVEIDAPALGEETAALEVVEAALRGAEPPGTVAASEPPRARRGRRLICTDAITLAGELRRG